MSKIILKNNREKIEYFFNRVRAEAEENDLDTSNIKLYIHPGLKKTLDIENPIKIDDYELEIVENSSLRDNEIYIGSPDWKEV